VWGGLRALRSEPLRRAWPAAHRCGCCYGLCEHGAWRRATMWRRRSL